MNEQLQGHFARQLKRAQEDLAFWKEAQLNCPENATEFEMPIATKEFEVKIYKSILNRFNL